MPRLIDMPIEEARAEKWQAGRQKYGADLLEQLYDELLDAMNYVEEAEREGFDLPLMAETLRRLCQSVRRVYACGKKSNPLDRAGVRKKARW